MATYTYETSADEDAALALELMKVNGQLVTQQKKPVDAQGLFSLFVADKLTPLRMQLLQSQMVDIQVAFMSADDAARQQMAAAVLAVTAKAVQS